MTASTNRRDEVSQLIGERRTFARRIRGRGRDRFGQADAGQGRDLVEQIGGAFETNFLVRRVEEEARVALLEREDAGFRMEGVDQLQGRAGVFERKRVTENDDAEATLLEPGGKLGNRGSEADVEGGLQDEAPRPIEDGISAKTQDLRPGRHSAKSPQFPGWSGNPTGEEPGQRIITRKASTSEESGESCPNLPLSMRSSRCTGDEKRLPGGGN